MEPGQSLPARLLAARERKGVDLYRAERDTKIRMRFLAALERGDYRDLPGAVYTKGFLRNYATYLGLDPDDVLRQWHGELGDAIVAEPVVAPPRPIAGPAPTLTFSPSIVVAALMTLGVVVFGIYLALQLLRFAKPPILEVTRPATAVVTVDESTTTYLLRGISSPGATVTVTAAGRAQPYRVTAGSNGSWAVDVELRRGQNQFEVGATDPETGKDAEKPVEVVITVPFLVSQTPTLALSQPVEGATFENGAIPIEGSATNAVTIVVSVAYVGPLDGPDVTPNPDPSAPPGPGPDPVALVPDASGGFATPLELTEGRWSVTVTATSEQGKTASLTRAVTVAYHGVNVVVEIAGGDAWLKVWIDGVLDPTIGPGGRVYRSGRTLTFTGESSIEIRTGSSGVTRFTLNGVALGPLGPSGVPETWLFAPPAPPAMTGRR